MFPLDTDIKLTPYKEVKINLIPWTTVLDEKHRENHPFKQIPWFEIPELDLKFTEVRVALKCESPP